MNCMLNAMPIQMLSCRFSARREERADSDVDFLVDFPRGYDLFAQRMPLHVKAINRSAAVRAH